MNDPFVEITDAQGDEGHDIIPNLMQIKSEGSNISIKTVKGEDHKTGGIIEKVKRSSLGGDFAKYQSSSESANIEIIKSKDNILSYSVPWRDFDAATPFVTDLVLPSIREGGKVKYMTKGRTALNLSFKTSLPPTMDHLYEIAKIMQNFINATIYISVDERELLCMIFQSKVHRQDDDITTSNGEVRIDVYFPYAWLESNDIVTLFYPSMCNTVRNIIHDAHISNHIPLEYTKCVKSDCIMVVNPDFQIGEANLPYYFQTDVIGSDTWDMSYFPYFVSPVCAPLPDERLDFKTIISKHEEEKREEALMMLRMIPSKWASQKHIFMEIGRALFTLFNGGEEGLKHWIAIYDDKSSKFKLSGDQLFETYSSFCNDNKITKETLYWYAMTYNHYDFFKWHNSKSSSMIMDAATCDIKESHTKMASFFHHLYRFEFAFDGKNWYKYDQGDFRWKICVNDLPIRSKIREVFQPRLKVTALQPEYAGVADSINILANKVTADRYKSTLIKELQEFFLIEMFSSKLDTNEYTTSFKNTVFEVLDNVLIPRTGKPEDFISLGSNVPYNQSYSYDHPLVVQVIDWFSKLFPNPTLRHAMMKWLSSFFRGKNMEKFLLFFDGGLNNGKSTFIAGLQMLLGSYMGKFDATFLTTAQSSPGSASPHLSKTKGLRLIIVDEMEGDVQVKTGVAKKITGSDKYPARELYSNYITEVKPLYRVAALVNKVPPMSGEGAMRLRVRVIPCEATFSKDAPDTLAEQISTMTFAIDRDFESKISKMMGALLWLMVKYWDYYAKDGLEFGQRVDEVTKDYWDNNDIYQLFINTKLVKAPNIDRKSGTGCTFGEVYPIFKEWFRNMIPGIKIPAAPIASHEFDSRMGKRSNYRWTYIIREGFAEQ